MSVSRIQNLRTRSPELRRYNRLANGYRNMRRDLRVLLDKGADPRRQTDLRERLGRLSELLMGLQRSFRLRHTSAAVIAALALMQGSPALAQSFSAAQTNPFGLTATPNYSTPALADLDGDGDLDIVSGRRDGRFSYYQNTGTATAPAFAAVSINPFGLADVGAYTSVAFDDIDGDGDLDLMAGEFSGDFKFMENVGSATAPSFAAPVTNPFGLANVGEATSAPRFVDLDADGDLDIVSGDKLGKYHYFQNTGTAKAPAYAAQVQGAFGWTDVGQYSTPAPADLDGDGDFDLMSGDVAGRFRYFQNTGTAIAPIYAAVVTNGFNLTDIGDFSAVTLKDLDADGDLDLLAGSKLGDFYYFENTQAAPATYFPGRQTNPFGLTDIGATTQDYSTSSLRDLDGDGDLDVLSGGVTGDFHYFRNDGTAIAPAFATEMVNPFGLANTAGTYPTPILVDIDADGDFDVLAGRSNGSFSFFQNTGTAVAPAFAAVVLNPFSLSDIGSFSTLAMEDVDADGDLDIIAGFFGGSFKLLENVGTANAPSFAAPVDNPFGLGDVGASSAPTLGDLDRDGDLDILSGEQFGHFFHMVNTGAATSPAYAAALDNPYGLSDIGQYSTPAFADLDRDGDLDVLSGALNGSFYYFENQPPAPALTVEKSATPMTYSAPANVINYSYLVTNTGNISVSSLTVADDNDNAPGVTCPVTTLAAGASTTCTSQRTVFQPDLDTGSITNIAIASAVPASGGSVNSPSDSVTVTADANPSLSLEKSAAPMTYSATGNVINYSYLVTNTGNLTLNTLAVADDNDDAPGVTCPVASLAPGIATTCTSQRTVFQPDLDAESITNVAIASSSTMGGSTVNSPSDSATVTAITNPSLSLVKSAAPMTYSATGNVINYSYFIRNTGNQTLYTLAVSDDNDDAPGVTCPVAILPPGVATICAAQRTVFQPDLDAESITNIAIASSSTQAGATVNSPSDSATVTAIANPSLSLVKSASPMTYSASGDVINYSYLVTNSGNQTLYSLAVADDNDDAPGVTCPVASLAPGGATTCTAQRTALQPDLDAGSITNVASASSSTLGGATVNSPSDSETVTVIANPSLSLVKSAGASTYSFPDEVISYSYLVTNTGNLTLSNLTVVDDNDDEPPGVVCPVSSLAPNAATTCTSQRTVTQLDIKAGSITNIALASGMTPQGANVDSPSDSATVTAEENPSLTLVKTAAPMTYASPGDVIGYSYRVTNTGNLTLSNLTVADDNDDPAGVSCPVTTLAPGIATTCTSQRTVGQPDLDAESITNVAIASSTSSSGGNVDSPSDSVTVTAITSPSLAMVKTALQTTYVSIGDVLNYEYFITNTGNLTLNNLTVDDDNDDEPPGVVCPVTTLSPSESTTCTSQRTIMSEDLRAPAIINTATASAFGASGVTVASAAQSVTVRGTAVPIPTLSPGGLLALIGTMFGLGLAFVRRRNREQDC